MYSPPPPPPPPIVITEQPCTADSKLCIYIPERITSNEGYPTSLGDLVEGIPREVGGFQAGQTIKGHEIPIWFLALVYNFFPEEQQRNAILVASCESGFDPNARSTTGDYGLWQHNRAYIQKRWDIWRESQGLLPQQISPNVALDPIINAKLTIVLLNLREGRWSGPSGWACGAKVGAR